MVRAPVEITLLRGRTEPEDAGRAEEDDVLLVEEARELLEEGLPLAEGFAEYVSKPVDRKVLLTVTERLLKA